MFLKGVFLMISNTIFAYYSFAKCPKSKGQMPAFRSKIK